jgi:hypothetical protein
MTNPRDRIIARFEENLGPVTELVLEISATPELAPEKQLTSAPTHRRDPGRAQTFRSSRVSRFYRPRSLLRGLAGLVVGCARRWTHSASSATAAVTNAIAAAAGRAALAPGCGVSGGGRVSLRPSRGRPVR